MGFKVAIVGATGNVGREMLNILEERGFPADEVVALASRRSVGTEVSYGDRTLKVKALENYDFSDTDICIMSAGGNVSKEWSPKIGRQGCVVIDNSSAWRYDQDVPLIVPEVNPDAISLFTRKNIIANPNCSTAQLVVAMKPLHDRATIKRIVVATYQSVSGAGKEGMDELFTQTRAVFVTDSVEVKKFTKRIAFNVIPHIDVFLDDGSTKEEWKMVAETKKMLDPKIKLTATCVRVPVFIGHSEAVNIEFEKPISADEARDILRDAPGCLVIDKREDGGYVTPLDSAGEDATFISRIREDPDHRERPVDVDRLGQSAQGCCAQCRADRRIADRARSHPAEAEGRLIRGSLSALVRRVARRRAAPSSLRSRLGPAGFVENPVAKGDDPRIVRDFGRIDQIIGEVGRHLDAELERANQPAGTKDRWRPSRNRRAPRRCRRSPPERRAMNPRTARICCRRNPRHRQPPSTCASSARSRLAATIRCGPACAATGRAARSAAVPT